MFENIPAEVIGYYICGFLLLISIIIAVAAQTKVTSSYNKYKKVASSLNMTGAELASHLASHAGVSIKIRSCNGTLTDHYDPRDKSLNISNGNYNSNSIAAHAIVAHEFGHALQDSENYFAFKVRQMTIKISNFVSKLLIPMLILGILFEVFLFAGVGNIIIYVYAGIYFLSFLVSLVTLPVEYNASKRAKKVLAEIGIAEGNEAAAVDSVLNSAALTYVASMLVNLAYLLRILSVIRIFKD